MRTAGIVLEAAGFLGCLLFVLLYAIGSDWRRSALGQNLMAKTALLGLLFGLGLLSLVSPIPPWIGLVFLAALDVVLYWRVWILWRIQHGQSGG